MTEPFDAVLAEITHLPRIYRAGVGACYGYDTGFILAKDAQALLDRLAAAHAAEDSEIREILYGTLDRDRDNITTRNLVVVAVNALQRERERAEAAERDARRYRWLRTNCVREWESDMPEDEGAPSLDIDFEADGHDLDAAIDAAIATTKHGDG